MEGFEKKGSQKAEGSNVQVVIRCRPVSEEEGIFGTPEAVFCDEVRGEVLAIHSIGSRKMERSFVFDKVFGPTSHQIDLFNQSISPILSKVLEGFHSTIFAYGQSGTGKTYTMEGVVKTEKKGELHSEAGVILRSVKQIFEELEAKCIEYTVNVSFLEIYNEEITDLFALEGWESGFKPTKPIILMEDGEGGVFVRGIEEERVYSADEIYKKLENATAKRHTTATLLNKNSSRSHSIFSITVHINEFSKEGEGMIKTGKLNLVDLAGSVNVLRSGAQEGRSREAGEINKSLLTLGRVINSLVDESSHIPYRDSKLTRLLRNSLGGNTKTCIIATISPSIYCLDETLNTLAYAYSARSIKNKPETNQEIKRPAKMKDLNFEIDRLKKELNATKEKNEICIPRDCFLHVDEKKEMTELMEHKKHKLKSKDMQLSVLQELYDSQQDLITQLIEKLANGQIKLEESEKKVIQQKENYHKMKCAMRENEYLIMKLQHSERELVEHLHSLRSELASDAADISGLFIKIDDKDNIEERNQINVQRFQSELIGQLRILHKIVSTSVMEQENQLQEIEEDMQSFVSMKTKATKELKGWVEKVKALYGSGITTLDGLAGELDQNCQLTFGKFYSQALTYSSNVDDCSKNMALEADNLLKVLLSNLSNQIYKLNVFAQLQHEEHQRTVEATRCISNTFISFFHMLNVHESRLSKILEETQIAECQELGNLERKFKECVDNEDKQILAKVVKLMESSNAQKQKLVQKSFGALRQNAAERTSRLQKEMCSAKNFTSLTKEQLRNYMEKTENYYVEDIAAVESRKNSLEESLNDCIQKTNMNSLLWENAYDFLLSLGKETITLVESIVRNGIETNQLVRANASACSTTALQDIDLVSKCLQSSINYSIQLDHNASANINSIIIPSVREQWNLKWHYQKIVKTKDCIDECLE